MEKTPKEMLKAYVNSQKFNSTTEIMDAYPPHHSSTHPLPLLGPGIPLY